MVVWRENSDYFHPVQYVKLLIPFHKNSLQFWFIFFFNICKQLVIFEPILYLKVFSKIQNKQKLEFLVLLQWIKTLFWWIYSFFWSQDETLNLGNTCWTSTKEICRRKSMEYEDKFSHRLQVESWVRLVTYPEKTTWYETAEKASNRTDSTRKKEGKKQTI